MRCSSCRAPGSAAQPVSWPWVAPTRRPHAGRAQRRARAGPAARRRRRTRCRSRAAGRARRRPGRSPGVGSSMPVRPPDHRVRQRGVVARPTPGSRRRARRPTSGGRRASSACDERLDAALPRREVVGDDQGAGHGRLQPCPVLARARSARRSSGASRRTTARPRAGRGRRGWSPARSRCMAMNASGSPVRSRACTSARASMCRDTRFCTGADTSVPTAIRNSTQRHDPRIARPSRRPARRSSARSSDTSQPSSRHARPPPRARRSACR